jgi:hypothetical protein
VTGGIEAQREGGLAFAPGGSAFARRWLGNGADLADLRWRRCATTSMTPSAPN